MIAIISDIHANLEALTAVLADIAARDMETVICLGDVVGYGPNPRECVDLIRKHATVAMMGNHDFAVLYEPENFNVGAEAAAFWTRQQLVDEPEMTPRNHRWDYFGELEIKHTLGSDEHNAGVGEMIFVHGSPRRPVNEYIFPDDVYNNANKIIALFERFDHLCFVGHTHVPGVFLETPDFYSPDELEFVFEVDLEHKALVNVGSVGQPRDRDPRASYVIVDEGAVRFIRVPYDHETTIKKVQAVPELDDYLGIRLREGR
jgi:diadenosine tetraphosphatase ApaH/serine/threonine PP2A family protein phosphatase